MADLGHHPLLFRLGGDDGHESQYSRSWGWMGRKAERPSTCSPGPGDAMILAFAPWPSTSPTLYGRSSRDCHRDLEGVVEGANAGRDPVALEVVRRRGWAAEVRTGPGSPSILPSTSDSTVSLRSSSRGPPAWTGQPRWTQRFERIACSARRPHRRWTGRTRSASTPRLSLGRAGTSTRATRSPERSSGPRSAGSSSALERQAGRQSRGPGARRHR